MKAYELLDATGLAGLKLVDKPVPKPDIGQVLVRIRAVTLNYRDLLTVKGGYGSRQKCRRSSRRWTGPAACQEAFQDGDINTPCCLTGAGAAPIRAICSYSS